MAIDWHARWQDGRTGFHESEVHPDLLTYSPEFLGDAPRRVLVPLCGKSMDLHWLAAQGHQVVGVEFVHLAVEQFFAAEGEAVPNATGTRERPAYARGNIRIVCADFFHVTRADVGPVDRVWDRAALVALPRAEHVRYAKKIRELCPKGLLLQNAVEYDTSVMDAPPESVPKDVVESLYGNATLLRREDILDREPKWRERGHRHFCSTAQLVHLE